MRHKSIALIAVLTLVLQGCGGEALSDDPEIASKQIDDQVDTKADTLEEAAAKAVEIRDAEIQSDTQEILREMGNGYQSQTKN